MAAPPPSRSGPDPVPFPPPAAPGSAAPSPASVAAAVAGLLARHGLTRVYVAACQVFAVVSVAAGLSVWTNGRVLWWTWAGEHRAWPAADPDGAAAHLAGLAGHPAP